MEEEKGTGAESESKKGSESSNGINDKEKDSKEGNRKSKKDGKEPRKEKDTLLYWSLAFIIAVIILFFAASWFFPDEPEYETIEYNHWEFTKIEGLWVFQWQKGNNLYQAGLRFNPLQVEDVPVYGKLNTTKFNSRNYVYITFDLSNESSQNMTALALASTELTQNIATAINRTPLAACVNRDNYACEERPVKTCTNTNEPVIYLKEGGKAAIILENSCITLMGEDFELLKSVDRLLYHWYGIIRQ